MVYLFGNVTFYNFVGFFRRAVDVYFLFFFFFLRFFLFSKLREFFHIFHHEIFAWINFDFFGFFVLNRAHQC
jgi:hypothetical protein